MQSSEPEMVVEILQPTIKNILGPKGVEVYSTGGHAWTFVNAYLMWYFVSLSVSLICVFPASTSLKKCSL